MLCVEWEAMERKLATGGHDGHVRTQTLRLYVFFFNCLQVRLWDPKTGKPIGEALKGHSKWITSLSWEPIHMYDSE